MVSLHMLCLMSLAVTLHGECAHPKCLFHMCDSYWGALDSAQLDKLTLTGATAGFLNHQPYNRGRRWAAIGRNIFTDKFLNFMAKNSSSVMMMHHKIKSLLLCWFTSLRITAPCQKKGGWMCFLQGFFGSPNHQIWDPTILRAVFCPRDLVSWLKVTDRYRWSDIGPL